jgi:hypothetical protein
MGERQKRRGEEEGGEERKRKFELGMSQIVNVRQ